MDPDDAGLGRPTGHELTAGGTPPVDTARLDAEPAGVVRQKRDWAEDNR